MLDVGAHIGGVAERFADELPDMRIHAFEPTPGSASLLRERAAHFRNVTVHEVALADRAGVFPFFLNRFEQTNSLLDNTGNGQTELAEHVRQISVRVTTLDEWCAAEAPSCDLVIKADMQGTEGRLVAGGHKTFADGRVAAFYSEVLFAPMYEGQTNFCELHELLTATHGLVLWQIYDLARDATGRAAWGDALWLRKDVLPTMGS